MSDPVGSVEQHPIDHQLVLTAAPVAVAAPNETECVVHNLETGATYRLNDVGTRVWELLEASSTIADITAAIRAEYQLPDDIPSQQVTDDVTKIVAELRLNLHLPACLCGVDQKRHHA